MKVSLRVFLALIFLSLFSDVALAADASADDRPTMANVGELLSTDPASAVFCREMRDRFGVEAKKVWRRLFSAHKAGGDWQAIVRQGFPGHFQEEVQVTTPVATGLAVAPITDDVPPPPALIPAVSAANMPRLEEDLRGISQENIEKAMSLIKLFTTTGEEYGIANIDATLDTYLPDETPGGRAQIKRALGFGGDDELMVPGAQGALLGPEPEIPNGDEPVAFNGPRNQFLNAGINLAGSNTWTTGFGAGDAALCPHYNMGFPKTPVFHQYNPGMGGQGARVPIAFQAANDVLCDRLPEYVRDQFAPVQHIAIVFQSMSQLTDGDGGLCFRPQTWISPTGSAFSPRAAAVQLIDTNRVHQDLGAVGYSLHDGVSSPNAPHVDLAPNADPFVVWSRTECQHRSIITGHVFVPFGFDQLFRRYGFRALVPQTVGEFYGAVTHMANVMEIEAGHRIQAGLGTDDDRWVSTNLRRQAQRVFEEDLGNIFKD